MTLCSFSFRNDEDDVTHLASSMPIQTAKYSVCYITADHSEEYYYDFKRKSTTFNSSQNLVAQIIQQTIAALVNDNNSLFNNSTNKKNLHKFFFTQTSYSWVKLTNVCNDWMQPKLDDCIFHQAILTATVLIDKRTSSSDHLMLAKKHTSL